MSWFVEHWIASSLLVIYVSVLFYNAYVGNKAATGVGGYYVGNRQLGGTVVGISFFATFASTNTFIGHAGKGYDYGVAWFTMAVLLVMDRTAAEAFCRRIGRADDSGLDSRADIGRQG